MFWTSKRSIFSWHVSICEMKYTTYYVLQSSSMIYLHSSPKETRFFWDMGMSNFFYDGNMRLGSNFWFQKLWSFWLLSVVHQLQKQYRKSLELSNWSFWLIPYHITFHRVFLFTWKIPFPGSFWLSRPNTDCFHSQPQSLSGFAVYSTVYIGMSYTVGKLRKCASYWTYLQKT